MACTFGSNLRELGQVGGRRKRKEAVRPQRQVSRGRGGSPRLHAGGSPESPGRYSLAHSYVDAIPFGYGEEVGLSPALAAAQPQAGLAGLSPASRQHRHARLAAVRRQRENHQTQRLPQSPVARPPHSVPQPTPPALRQGSPGTPRPSPRFQARASPHPRFTNLPSSPLRDPSFEMAERMKAWKPELPFPFDVDLEEYDPIGSQQLINFEKQRSEEAHQRYLDEVERSRRAVDGRRRKREAEHDDAKQRVMEREAARLRDQQLDVQLQLEEEAHRERCIQRAMEREVERLAKVRDQRESVRQQEAQLDEEYERQLEGLRERGRNMDLYISRAATRTSLRKSLDTTLNDTLTCAEETQQQLQAEVRMKDVLHEEAHLRLRQDARSTIELHESLELGRTMRLAGITRADVAAQLGLITVPNAV